MAASMYIVVEGEDPGYDIFVNGRALARHEDALERLATVRTLVAALKDDPQQLGTEGPQVLAELEEYARVLERTMQAGLRWHLAVSWR
jgi:hypothetical protein